MGFGQETSSRNTEFTEAQRTQRHYSHETREIHERDNCFRMDGRATFSCTIPGVQLSLFVIPGERFFFVIPAKRAERARAGIQKPR